MASRKSLLSSVARVRHGRADEAARELRAAVLARENAQAQQEAAERVRADRRALIASTEAGARRALEAGALRAADLAVADAWRQKALSDLDALAARVSAEALRVRDTAQRESVARAALARRAADCKLIDGHRERLEASERRAAEDRADEAVLEAWRPRR